MCIRMHVDGDRADLPAHVVKAKIIDDVSNQRTRHEELTPVLEIEISYSGSCLPLFSSLLYTFAII